MSEIVSYELFSDAPRSSPVPSQARKREVIVETKEAPADEVLDVVGARVPPAVRARIDAIAASRECSRSDVIRRAIDDYLA